MDQFQPQKRLGFEGHAHVKKLIGVLLKREKMS